MKSILFTAFHFPPCFGSSGLQRTLSYVRYFDESPDWAPVVLSAARHSYPNSTSSQMSDIPANVEVHRAFAVDSARHLAFRGKHWGRTSIPDRWKYWYYCAVPLALGLIRKHRPRVIWSTYPISTAHSIAATASKLSGIPWVCDFRDPMVEHDEMQDRWFPSDRRVRQSRLRIETRCAKQATKFVFCTGAARRIFCDRYPHVRPEDCAVIQNGFDEQIFSDVERRLAEHSRPPATFKTLVHSGTLYPGEDRNPAHFFEALSTLKKRGLFESFPLQIVLRATGYDEIFKPMIDKLGLTDIIRLGPAVGYREAIEEMFSADGLLIFQGRTSNPAIPAKLYEYIRIRKPILAMVHNEGETAKLLSTLGIGTQVSLTDSSQIAAALQKFVSNIDCGKNSVLGPAEIERYSRKSRARDLERVFNDIVVSNA